MSVTTLRLTAHDPIIARDGRPFGAGQGNRMRSLSWPLPSVVAGSFRTALVKANPGLDFTKATPLDVLRVEVAGAFPMNGGVLYLPAPNDCVWDEQRRKVFRVRPIPLAQDGREGVDLPAAGLAPVQLAENQAQEDFKPEPVPPCWPLEKYTDWLVTGQLERGSDWFDGSFLNAAIHETRDHVCLDANTGAAEEGQIFATTGLNVTRLPRHGVPDGKSWNERFAEITLAVRVTIAERAFQHVENLSVWHPLGGERRLVHWQQTEENDLWKCPARMQSALESASLLRMVLVTPAIFDHGWRPGWLDADTLEGKPIGDGPTLRLIGISNGRWKAVSGWSLASPRGPKPIRRMVPAGSVYFFEKVEGDGRILGTNGWLKSVSDAPQDRNDGFGLAVWGTW